MKVLVVYAHPYSGSFNNALCKEYIDGLRETGHVYDLIDLYADYFNPVLKAEDFQLFQQGKAADDIAKYQEKVLWADAMVFICPVWWFSIPAVLKGWIDRVFSIGFAYGYGENGLVGLLKHQKVVIIQTCGGTEDAYENYGFKAGMEKSIDDGIFRFCGIQNVQHEFLYNVIATTDEVRKGYLAKVKELASSI
ncbi:MAG: NAD(P)H-dependent oxidoreductase [Armatimonadota bacterium]